MEVEIISSETIKPSSFPPNLHLKSFELSVLDHLAPFAFTPLVFFYTLNESNDDHTLFHLSHNLKTSLSKALFEFYLLAGTIKDNTQILANGAGALFQVARVHGATMSEFLNQPSLESLSQLTPFRSTQIISSSTTETNPQIVVQLNAFNGGGVAVGVCFLHKIIDGITMSNFLRHWATAAGAASAELEIKGGGGLATNQYTAVSKAFPGRDYSLVSKTYLPFKKFEGRVKRRRFVFECNAILEVKEELVKEGKNLKKNPTSVEVVTAFIWKYMMIAARQRSSDFLRPSVVAYSVDLRRRMAPPLPQTSIGNIIWTAVAHHNSSDDAEIELSKLVNLIQQSFAEIDDKFIREMTGEEGFQTISKKLMRMEELYSSKPYSYLFSSWRNMGLNEVDFGWGKPLWVSLAGPEKPVLKNVVVLKEDSLGDGIEAWVMLDEDEMNILENDQQFLAFASHNPTIHLS